MFILLPMRIAIADCRTWHPPFPYRSEYKVNGRYVKMHLGFLVENHQRKFSSHLQRFIAITRSSTQICESVRPFCGWLGASAASGGPYLWSRRCKVLHCKMGKSLRPWLCTGYSYVYELWHMFHMSHVLNKMFNSKTSFHKSRFTVPRKEVLLKFKSEALFRLPTYRGNVTSCTQTLKIKKTQIIIYGSVYRM